MNLPVKIASRTSPLALAQVEEIVRELKAQGKIFHFETARFETTGDVDKTTPLTQSSDNFFTDTIDRAILDGSADIAVHSAKDLPQDLPAGLAVFALTQGLDSHDAWVGGMHWKDLPLGAKVGTSSVLRQNQILQMRPDAVIVNIRGTIHERLELIKQGVVDGVVVAACALKRLNLEGEIKDIFPWEGMPLQGQLAVVGRQDDVQLANLFSAIDARRRYGKVILAGAGPGDPELITLKGIRALERADCVFYDYLVNADLLTYAPRAEHIFAGKRKGEHSLSQEDLSRMLKEKAIAGKNVVRLKGGDPLIFGRGRDEIQYLRSFHIDVKVIPGVSSATGIPSSLGIPLTARGISSSVAFLSAHEEDEDKNGPRPVIIPQAQTLVFLMGLTKLSIIIESMEKSGWPKDTPVMIIANGTKAEEQIVKGTLSNVENLSQTRNLRPPALIIAGKIVGLYKPGLKKSFLHCGTHPQLYERLGKIIHWPMIDIKPASFSAKQKKDLIEFFETADIIICTSWYAGEYFYSLMADEGPYAGKSGAALKPNLKELLKSKTFAVIGQRTAKALDMHGIKAAIVSPEETAQGLLKAIKAKINLKGKRILFPRSSLPNPFLKTALTREGAQVSEVAVYENTKPAKRDLPMVKIDGVIFTSPSTVVNFLADYATIPADWQIWAKGPVTLKTLQEAGYAHAASLP